MTMAMTIGVGGVLPRAARAPRASTLAARAPVRAQAAKRKGFGKKPAKPAKKSAPAEPAYDPKNPLGLTTVEQVPRVGAQQPAGDAQEAEGEEPAEISPVVTDRILKRILTFTSAPLAVAFASPVFFYWANKIRDPPLDVPTSVVYLASLFTFGPALAGISYAIISCSYDPEREEPEGFLGSAEFARNLPEIVSQLRGGRR